MKLFNSPWIYYHIIIVGINLIYLLLKHWKQNLSVLHNLRYRKNDLALFFPLYILIKACLKLICCYCAQFQSVTFSNILQFMFQVNLANNPIFFINLFLAIKHWMKEGVNMKIKRNRNYALFFPEHTFCSFQNKSGT